MAVLQANVATSGQAAALRGKHRASLAVHDAMPDHLPVAVPLGAFEGVGVSEASALRVEDVDYMGGVVNLAFH